MKSRTRKYRCGRDHCRRIYHLGKHPEEYRTPRRCDCGGELHDYSSDRRRNRTRTCQCDGYPYPHKKGWGPWCQHHPTGPSEAEMEERFGRRGWAA